MSKIQYICGRGTKGCDNWVAGMSEIIAQQVYCANRPAAPKYTTEAFYHCPWCGEELVEDE
jgi:hypothetical protein